MNTPQELAAQSLKQQLGGQASQSAPPTQVGPVRSAVNAVGNAVNPFSPTNAVMSAGSAYNTFMSNLQSHLVSMGQGALNTLIVNPATRIAQGAIQTANEFQNPGYDTPVDTGNPQRQNAGGMATPLPVNAPIPGVNTSNSETNLQQPQTTLGQTVAPLRSGIAGAKQIAGQGLQAGAYLAAPELSEGAMGAPNLLGKMALGAGTGYALGAAGGAGQDLANNPNSNLQTITQSAQSGANQGAVVGGALGGVGGLLGGKGEIPAETPQPISPSESAPIETPAKTSPYNVPIAQAARETASTNAVQGINQMNQTAQSDLSQMGQEFQAGSQKIDTSNPNGGMELSSSQLDRLNNLKESKKFSLPTNLDAETNPLINSPMSKDFLAKNTGKISDIQNAGKVKLTASQTQDLITRLNKLTFDAKASGDLAVNQQTIGLTNELKTSASKAFGSEWDKIYTKYSAGRGVLEKLDGIVNLDKNANPTDLMKQFQTIAKLHETPEGQKLLDQAVQAYKTERGIDLTDPVQAVNQVLKSQGQLEIAQKGNYGHQLMTALKSPNLAARRVAYLSTAVLGLAAGATLLRKQIAGLFSGQ